MIKPEDLKGASREVDLEIVRQQKIVEINRLLGLYYDKLEKDEVTEQKVDENLRKQIELGKVLESKGLEPTNYLFWHIMIGSTLPPGISESDMEFDTPEGDIERLIREITV